MSGQHSGHGQAHGHQHGPGCHHSHGDMAADDGKATDPVCGMKVDPATSEHRLDHDGTTFHFCSAGCRRQFESDPGKYLAPKVATAPTVAPKGAVYTCPMHPQIRQEGPGNCPICGMALEPLDVTADTGPNHELIDMTQRMWIGLALTIPVFVLEMSVSEATAPYLAA